MPATAPSDRPTSLGDRAADDLRFIRDAMARTATFTAVPGVGGALMGVVGLAAAIVASRQPTADRWLGVWLVAAVLASPIGVVGDRPEGQAGRPAAGRSDGPELRHRRGRAACWPARPITFGLWTARTYATMPAVWLLLYGTGVLVGGVFTVPVVRLTGALFMLFGIAAVLMPPEYGNVWLGVGFGVLQIGGGIFIARRHGG